MTASNLRDYRVHDQQKNHLMQKKCDYAQTSLAQSSSTFGRTNKKTGTSTEATENTSMTK